MKKFSSTYFFSLQIKWYIFFTICFLSLNLKAQTPQFDWVQLSYTTFRSNAESVAIDNQGNVFYAGEFAGVTDFDPGPVDATLTNIYYPISSCNGYIAKVDSNKNLLWAHSILTDIQVFLTDMKIDSQGNIYIMGDALNNTQNLYYNNDTLNSISGYFLMKLDNDGNFIWIKSLSYQGSFWPQFDFFDIDDLDNIYITGNFFDTVDFNFDTGIDNLYANTFCNFILKLNVNGDFVWVKNIGLSLNNFFLNNYSLRINSDNVDAFYITGKNAPGCDIDPDTSTYILNNTGDFIAKFDSAGHFLWVNQYNNIYQSYVAINDNGESYCIGSFTGTVDFDADTSTYLKTAIGNYDIFISKLSVDGTLEWVKTIGSPQGDYGQGIQLLNDQTIIISGVFSENMNFSDSLNPIILSSQGKRDIFIAQLNENGNTTWAKSFGGDENDYSNSLYLNQESIFLSGAFYDTVDFDLGPTNNQISSNAGSIIGELFVLKLNQSVNVNQSNDTITICAGDTILLNSGYTAGTLWNTGDTTQYLSVATNGVYFANINNGSIYTDTTTVIVIPSNNLASFSLITNDTLVCLGSQVEISVPISASSYLWSINGSIISSSDSLITANVDSALNVMCYIPNSSVCPLPLGIANQSILLNHFPATAVNYTAQQGNNWICTTDPSFTLAGGMPAGGNYAGTAVFNNVFIPNAAFPNLNFVSYTFIDSNLCSNQAIDTLFVTVCTDIIDSNKLMPLQVFPNPANDLISIKINDNIDSCFITISDIAGSTMLTATLAQKINEINISTLSSGMYFISANFKDKQVISKFIKK